MHVDIPLSDQEWIRSHLNYIRIAAAIMGRTPEQLIESMRTLSDAEIQEFRGDLLSTARHLPACVHVLRAVRYRFALCRPLPDGPEDGPSAA